jgi:hypothetical protein
MEIPWERRSVNLVESNGGKLAAVLAFGPGRTGTMNVIEVDKGGSPSKKAPYWVKRASWKGKGRCTMVFRQIEQSGKQSDEFYFTDLVLYETEAPYNPDQVKFAYLVDVEVFTKRGWFKEEREVWAVRVMASSGGEARMKIAGHQEDFGIPKEARIEVRGARPELVTDSKL